MKPPSYNGNIGLVIPEASEGVWKLASYQIEPKVDQYDTSLRLRETWSKGEAVKNARSQFEITDDGIGRSWPLSEDAVALTSEDRTRQLMTAFYQDEPFIPERELRSEYSRLSPAIFGLYLHRYLTDLKTAGSAEE